MKTLIRCRTYANTDALTRLWFILSFCWNCSTSDILRVFTNRAIWSSDVSASRAGAHLGGGSQLVLAVRRSDAGLMFEVHWREKLHDIVREKLSLHPTVAGRRTVLADERLELCIRETVL
jgi:hypothetical protein